MLQSMGSQRADTTEWLNTQHSLTGEWIYAVCVCVCVCVCVGVSMCVWFPLLTLWFTFAYVWKIFFKSLRLKVYFNLCVIVAQLCPALCDPMNVAHQTPLSVEFSRQEYWSGLPFTSPADLPEPGIKPGSPILQAYSLPSKPPGKPILIYQVWNKLFTRCAPLLGEL